MMLSSSRTFVLAALAATALVAQAESDMPDPVLISFSNETDSNTTEMMDFCTCGEEGISCLDAADEEACMCEDGDVICMEDETPAEVTVEAPVAAPVAMDDEPLAPDMDSGAASNTMVSVAVSAMGIAALALN